jgi:HSP20 family protein
MRLYSTSMGAPVFGLRREIDRLFDDMMGGTGAMSAWNPAVDIREDQSELCLSMELPGLAPEDVEITTDNGVLTVRGEKHDERKEGEENRYHLVERSYGSFTRSFQLPQGLDEGKIAADFNLGVLKVHIPKAALPQPRKIQIGATGSTKGQQQVSGTSNGNK